MLLVLVACNKENVVENTPTTPSEPPKNELVYQGNGETKTTTARTTQLSTTGKTIKVPEGFALIEKEIDVDVQGENELEGVNIGITLLEKPESPTIHRLKMHSLVRNDDFTEFQSDDYSDLIEKYSSAYTGQSDKHKVYYFATNKETNNYEAFLFLPLDKATPENEAILLAILQSYTY